MTYPKARLRLGLAVEADLLGHLELGAVRWRKGTDTHHIYPALTALPQISGPPWRSGPW